MFNKILTKASLSVITVATALALSSTSHAAIVPVYDDFQGYGSATTFSPWLGFSDNAGLGAYSFTPSTSGPQITALADDGAGNFYMNFYANYDNAAVHNNPPLQEAISVFRQLSFTGADTATGDTWVFDFQYSVNPDAPPSGDTEVGAFIRVFDPVFNLLDEQPLDTSGAGSTFTDGQLSVTLNPAWIEGFVQIGFNNLVGNGDDSGMFYDNVSFTNSSVVPVPAAVWLFGSGLLGLVGIARRRKS